MWECVIEYLGNTYFARQSMSPCLSTFSHMANSHCLCNCVCKLFDMEEKFALYWCDILYRSNFYMLWSYSTSCTLHHACRSREQVILSRRNNPKLSAMIEVPKEKVCKREDYSQEVNLLTCTFMLNQTDMGREGPQGWCAGLLGGGGHWFTTHLTREICGFWAMSKTKHSHARPLPPTKKFLCICKTICESEASRYLRLVGFKDRFD